MSQFAPPDDSTFNDAGSDVAPRTSPLAVWSLVCSLIFCCPLTTILGALLGVISLATLKNKPHLRGKGLAIAAILIGVILSALWIWGGAKFGDLMKRSWDFMSKDAPMAVMEGSAGDKDAFRAAFWGTGAAATDAEVDAFFVELEQRYGALQAVRFDQTQPAQPRPGQPVAPFPYLFDFTSGSRGGIIEIVFADPTTGQFVLKIQSVTVRDGDDGDLVFPAN